MFRAARAILLCSLALLQSLCGVGSARAFVLCICVDGGIVLEAHGESCRCCAVDACCPSEEAGEEDAAGACACVRFTIQGEDAGAQRSTPELQAGGPTLQVLPAWSRWARPHPSGARGPRDADPDPHDPLRDLRTVVLRH